jgi:hypothetical protein
MSVPETAVRKDWPRLVKLALDALERRARALEGNPTFAGVTWTPGAAPASPVEGQTYYDATTHKLRSWNGTAWFDLF